MNRLIEARQSGRTTRMLLSAFEYAEKGRMVYILCTDSSRSHIEHLCKKLCIDGGYSKDVIERGIKFETLRSIGGSDRVDWKKQNLYQSHPNCRLLIDHHVYETEFLHILSGYMQYDE